MRNIYAALLCTLPIGLCGQVGAQSQTDTLSNSLFRLNEIILVGNQQRDPVMTEAYTGLVRRVVQPRNVADLFSEVNGFALVRRGNYAIDPSLRGAMYEQLNVQFDGGTRIMHACPNRMDPITTHVSPEEIERIEVIKGPFSTRYGPNFGGVINLVTRDSRELGEGLHGNLSTGYESNGDAYLNTLRLQQVWSQSDLGIQAGWRDFGNYSDGGSTEIPSAFESFDYKLEYGQHLGKAHRLELNWRQSFGRDVLHAGLPMDTREDNSSMVSLDYRWDTDAEWVRGISAKAYHSFVDHIMTNEERPSFQMVEAVATVDARTLGGRLEAEWEASKNWNGFLGLDFNGIQRDGTRNRLVKRNPAGVVLPQPVEFTDKIWQDSRLSTLGLFAEGRRKFSEGTWLSGGLRLDWVASDIRDPATDFAAYYPELGSRSEAMVSGHLSLKRRLSSSLVWETALGRGVRAANMVERYINHFTVGQDPYEYVGNPELRAEVNHQLETGIKAAGSLGGGPEQYRYSASVYYSLVSDYILPVIDPTLNRKYMPMAQPTEVKRFINIDRAVRTGFEASAGLDFFSYFEADASLSYVYTRNTDLDESLPLTPPFTGRFTLGFEKDRYWANIRYSVTARQGNTAPSFGELETPGYEVWDLRAGTEIFPGMQLGLAALNVFDKQYNNHLNFAFTNQADFGRVPITDPGRNFSAYVQYSF